MAKESFERTKPHVNIGTIGHVAHAAQLSVASLLTLALALKCPLAQAAHVWSLVTVATALVC